jgi:hypothetical protein
LLLLPQKQQNAGPLKSKAFSNQLFNAFKEFNPDLHLTVANFQRNTVTDLFAGM